MSRNLSAPSWDVPVKAIGWIMRTRLDCTPWIFSLTATVVTLSVWITACGQVVADPDMQFDGDLSSFRFFKFSEAHREAP